MDRIIYRRTYSSYICIENCRGEYNTIYYYMHACMIPICLGTSYQVHSYLFSFFMRESFSSCLLVNQHNDLVNRPRSVYLLVNQHNDLVSRSVNYIHMLIY